MPARARLPARCAPAGLCRPESKDTGRGAFRGPGLEGPLASCGGEAGPRGGAGRSGRRGGRKGPLPVDGGDAGDRVVVADALGQEPVADLPGEHGGVLPLVLGDLIHHFGRRHFGLGAADHAGLDAAGLVVPAAPSTDPSGPLRSGPRAPRPPARRRGQRGRGRGRPRRSARPGGAEEAGAAPAGPAASPALPRGHCPSAPRPGSLPAGGGHPGAAARTGRAGPGHPAAACGRGLGGSPPPTHNVPVSRSFQTSPRGPGWRRDQARGRGLAGGGGRCGQGGAMPPRPRAPVLPAQDLADAAVADPQLPGNVTGSHPLVSQLHDPLSHHVR